jgi:hypothetical protein
LKELVVRFQLESVVAVDLDRLMTDPNWTVISQRYNLGDLEENHLALEDYLKQYMLREVLLKEVPFSNGPAVTIAAHLLEVRQTQ